MLTYGFVTKKPCNFIFKNKIYSTNFTTLYLILLIRHIAFLISSGHCCSSDRLVSCAYGVFCYGKISVKSHSTRLKHTVQLRNSYIFFYSNIVISRCTWKLISFMLILIIHFNYLHFPMWHYSRKYDDMMNSYMSDYIQDHT